MESTHASTPPIPQTAYVLIVAGAAAAGALAGVVVMDFVQDSMLRGPTFGVPYACNVIGVQVHGTIVGSVADIPIMDFLQTYDEMGVSTITHPNYTVTNEVEDRLRYYREDPTIRGLLIDVQSSGGGVVPGNELASAFKNFGRPSAAVIHEIGASAGYLAAASGNIVFAAKGSLVGSIGVTSSYVDNVRQNEKDGLTFNQLSSGPLKDTFNPNKTLTKAERDLIMADLKILRDSFVQRVADFRGKTYEAIDQLADGSTLLGNAALEKGLIDKIGGTDDAIAYLEEQIGEPVTICWQ